MFFHNHYLKHTTHVKLLMLSMLASINYCIAVEYFENELVHINNPKEDNYTVIGFTLKDDTTNLKYFIIADDMKVNGKSNDLFAVDRVRKGKHSSYYGSKQTEYDFFYKNGKIDHMFIRKDPEIIHEKIENNGSASQSKINLFQLAKSINKKLALISKEERLSWDSSKFEAWLSNNFKKAS